MLTLENYTLKQLRLQYPTEYKKQIVDFATQYIYYEMYGLESKSELIYDCLVENTGLNYFIENYALL